MQAITPSILSVHAQRVSCGEFFEFSHAAGQLFHQQVFKISHQQRAMILLRLRLSTLGHQFIVAQYCSHTALHRAAIGP
jgi:hypothetical protein